MHPAIDALVREVDSPYSAVIATDLDGVIVSWNRAAEALYGWRRDEVIGRDVLSVTPSSLSAEAAANILTLLRRGRSWSGSFMVRGKDGIPFLAEVTDMPVRDHLGELVGIVGVSRRAQPAAAAQETTARG